MKIKSHIAIVVSGLSLLATGYSFATAPIELPIQYKTITLNTTQYTLNVCSVRDRTNLKIKILSQLGGTNASLTEKSRVSRQLTLLSIAWVRACNISGTGAINNTTGNDFVTIINPEFLGALSPEARNAGIERSAKYSQQAVSSVDSMIQRGVLTLADKDTMRKKITITYVNDCSKIDGKTTVKQRYSGTGVWIENELLTINLNVSVCTAQGFTTSVEKNISHVITHEIGHYIYYMKDTHPKQFEAFCWVSDGVKNSTCSNQNGFFSDYAMTNNEEDYAESFAFRYLNSPAPVESTIIKQKKTYFENLFK